MIDDLAWSALGVVLALLFCLAVGVVEEGRHVPRVNRSTVAP